MGLNVVQQATGMEYIDPDETKIVAAPEPAAVEMAAAEGEAEEAEGEPVEAAEE